MNGCICSETTQMLYPYILNNILRPYSLINLTNRKGSELINRPTYWNISYDGGGSYDE